MTLQQTLEKLAVVAGDWIQNNSNVVDGKVFSVNGDTFTKGHFLIKAKLWQLLGAICDKVEAEGWDWVSYKYKPNNEMRLDYYFGISPLGSLEDGEVSSATDNTHPVHAAAQALLAALSLNNTCVCGGSQKVKTIPMCDSGDFTEVMVDCPVCS